MGVDILVHYSTINNLASDCTKVQSTLNQQRSSLDASLQALPPDWTGTASEAFMSAYQQWSTAATDMAKALGSISELLTDTANGYQKLEQQAAGVFPPPTKGKSGPSAATVPVPPPPSDPYTFAGALGSQLAP